MNLLHLKYAVEVEKTRSINKAAENLFMGQPNLSRAIKELEDSLGITIFKRTSKGISPTPRGEEFLQHAKKILAQVDQVEQLFKNQDDGKQTFSISVPRSSYVCNAFTSFVGKLDRDREIEIYYKETNSMRAITNILQADYKLGIIRYQTSFEQYFKNMLHEKDLTSEIIYEFSYSALFSENSPLAQKDVLEFSDLSGCIEIAHADPYVPSLPLVDVKKAEFSDFVTKRIFVFERASQFDLLSKIPNSFMWVSPVPENILKQYGLTRRKCPSYKKKYRDVLIYRKGTHLTNLDKMFLAELQKSRDSLVD